jgi:hypothetical protein
VRSLAPERKRADRLFSRVVVSEAEATERMNRMSDGELEATMIRAIERLVGPAVAFEGADAFAQALSHRLCGDVTNRLSAMLRAHWAREQWLRTHATHSLVVVAPQVCVQPLHGHWGPGVVLACGCGVRLAVLNELVPAWTQTLPRCEVDRECDFVPPGGTRTR